MAAPRVAYADLEGHPLLAASGPALRAALFDADEGPVAALAGAALASAGPFARAARRGALTEARLQVAAAELRAIGQAARALEEQGRAAAPPVDRPPAYRALLAALMAAPDWGGLAGEVARFHRAEGCGPLATHRVLRFRGGALQGVDRPDPIAPADLVGGEARRAALAGDLDAFVAGAPVNDALLYGPPGTGKSATARALAAGRAAGGLRLVQVDRDEVDRLPEAFALLEGVSPPCLVLLDDLVFDDAGRADRALRDALEGTVAARPVNVLVWATSNRMKLVGETWTEREGAVDPDLARGEKAALATRFGRRVRFDAPGQEEYVAIALGLLERRLGRVPPGAREAALRFAIAGHGMTPRTAVQFARGWRAA
jgi:predicted AAA+ superfamily ATPase